MKPRINLITLGVKDLERSLEFYRDGLGWKVSSASQGDVAFLPLGGIVLGLYPREKLAEDARVEPEGSGFSGITLAYNAKSEGEVDGVFAHLKKIGARIVKPPEKVFWGGYSGYFADPDGHLWEVAFNPFFPFDENDNLNLPE